MNIQTPVRPDQNPAGANRLGIVDCDIHPAVKQPTDLSQYLSERWREHLKTFGSHVRQAAEGSKTISLLTMPTTGSGASMSARSRSAMYGSLRPALPLVLSVATNVTSG